MSFLSHFILLFLLVLLSPLEAGEIIYQTNFTAPLFSVGALSGQDGWITQSSSSSTVSTEDFFSGNQSVKTAGDTLEKNLTSSAPYVWVDLFIKDQGSSAQAIIPSSPCSAVLFFSSSRGLLALDGDGKGNGVFTSINTPLTSDKFLQVTLKIDYPSATYEVWIDGKQKASHLGFKDNTVKALHSFQRISSSLSWLDALTITTWGLDEDLDTDGIPDLDEINYLYPFLLNPEISDCDFDGHSDGEEILLGSNPNDNNSSFTPLLSKDTDNHPILSFHAIENRRYTLQRSTTLVSDSWVDVPGQIDITVEQEGFLQLKDSSAPPSPVFYRIKVSR